MSEKKQNPARAPARTNGAGLIAGGGVLSGLFAVVGASCCVLPVLLVNLGVTGALVANLAIFAKYRAAMVGVALALVIAAIVCARRGGRRPPQRLWFGVGAALFFVSAASGLTRYEGALLQWMNFR